MVHLPRLFLSLCLAQNYTALLCSQRVCRVFCCAGNLQVCALKSCGQEVVVCWVLWQQGSVQIFCYALFRCGSGHWCTPG